MTKLILDVKFTLAGNIDLSQNTQKLMTCTQWKTYTAVKICLYPVIVADLNCQIIVEMQQQNVGFGYLASTK